MAGSARTSLIAYASIAAVVLVLGIRLLHRDGAQATSPAPRAAAPALERAPRPRALVHVAGAVRRPGVYAFDAGARVRDALRRAGGASRAGDPNAINLAAKLSDGQQVLIPRRATPAAPSGAGATAPPDDASSPSGPVSLGSATLEQLDSLDGVGPVTARKILERRQQGGLASVDDLAQVPGIGPKRLESLRRQLAP